MDSDWRTSFFGGTGGIVALFALAYNQHQSYPAAPALWTNPYWIWGIVAATIFTLWGIYEYFAPRMELWLPPPPKPENRNKWRLIGAFVVIALLGPPLVILAVQTGVVYASWFPWIWVGVFAVAVITSRSRRTETAVVQGVPARQTPAPLLSDKSDLLTDYHRLNSLVGRLFEFRDEMENYKPTGPQGTPLKDVTKQFMAYQAKLHIEYQDRFSREVVTEIAYFKLKYGLGRSELSDERTLSRSLVFDDLNTICGSLQEIVEELGQIHTDETLNAKQR